MPQARIAAVEIRRTTHGDEAKLLEAAGQLHLMPAADGNAVSAFLRDPSCISFLALEGDQVVGSLYGYALRRPETLRPKYFLYELDVLESHRRRGIGRALISAFLDDAKSQNAIGAWVQAKSLDIAARSFYKSCGGLDEDDGDILFSFPIE